MSTKLNLVRRALITTTASALAAATLACSTPSGNERSSDEQYVREALDSYFNGLKAGNVSGVPFAPNVTFETPLFQQPLRGEPAVRQALAGMMRRLQNIRVERYIIDGEHACALFEIDWTAEVVAHSTNYFRFADRRIVEVRVYFDPRALVSLQLDELRDTDR